MNNQIFNPYEGQEVGKLVWPFYRHSALIPEQIGGDLFVWLYLSLVSYENQNQGLSRDTYNETVKQNVEKIILDKFSAVIDNQTLEKIIHNAEAQFVDSGKIKEDTFSFIDTYESLFSDKLDVKYIYQDAITGEVLPFFGDTSGIEDSRDTDRRISETGVKEPSKKAVKKAYQQYIKIKKHNNSDEDQLVELNDEFIDEDEQTFLDDSIDAVSFSEEKKEEKSLKNYNVIFLNGKRVLFNLEVPIVIEDNSLVPRSPFGKNSNQWIGKCMKKGRNVSAELDAQLKELEVFIVEEKKIETYIESHKKDFASSLHACQTIYRMIDSLNDNKIRKYVIQLDSNFYEQSEMFYFYCGKYLERLIKKVSYQKSDSVVRDNTDYDTFCREIENKCRQKSMRYSWLQSQGVFNDWKKKYCRKDGKEFASFKADVADIILQTDLVSSPLMYPTFIDDMFDLYSKRSAVDHDDDNTNVEIKQTCIEKLLKITKVLFELI